ncbi:MAG: hypothetical protein SPF57_10525 [Streptococcus orisratti]|uniref:hypothetical protein n=1 Tax=Streptococcus orisratti TaxID=114652 RepID=UPI002A866A82|nr:hypothetical protein [Streptococcus orisratti]MDY4002119.1 hypothetical protein [Streptococcus orisratti]MDY5636736.1 hypothetical protein [Streptococcus orisratti]
MVDKYYTTDDIVIEAKKNGKEINRRTAQRWLQKHIDDTGIKVEGRPQRFKRTVLDAILRSHISNYSPLSSKRQDRILERNEIRRVMERQDGDNIEPTEIMKPLIPDSFQLVAIRIMLETLLSNIGLELDENKLFKDLSNYYSLSNDDDYLDYDEPRSIDILRSSNRLENKEEHYKNYIRKK